jgi:hypothetical protein
MSSSDFLSSGFPTKILYAFPISPTSAICSVYFVSAIHDIQ